MYDPKINHLNQRRHTFSIKSYSGHNQPKTTSRGRPRRSLSPNTSTLLTLTEAQAQVRKWFYAMFTYIVVIFIILVPIRRYVGIYALSGHEPFGWALGYLLGNLPQFRFWTVSANLERWVALPDRLQDLADGHRFG